MRNDYRDRDREPERWRNRNRGMFGYEGEGFMSGADIDRDRYYRDRDVERDWNIGGHDYEPRSFRGVGPRGYQRSDQRLHEEVCERLAWDHDVDAGDIEVAVVSGVVTLTGTVPDRRTKRLAEDITESVNGVHDVQNHLNIRRLGHHDRDDEPLQSGVIGLSSTENMDEIPARRSAFPQGDGRTFRGSAGPGISPAAGSQPMTNPGAPATGTGSAINSGVVSGNTSAGERARRRR